MNHGRHSRSWHTQEHGRRLGRVRTKNVPNKARCGTLHSHVLPYRRSTECESGIRRDPYPPPRPGAGSFRCAMRRRSKAKSEHHRPGATGESSLYNQCRLLLFWLLLADTPACFCFCRRTVNSSLMSKVACRTRHNILRRSSHRPRCFFPFVTDRVSRQKKNSKHTTRELYCAAIDIVTHRARTSSRKRELSVEQAAKGFPTRWSGSSPSPTSCTQPGRWVHRSASCMCVQPRAC